MVAKPVVWIGDRAIRQAKRLRQTIMQMGELQRDIEEEEAEEEEERQSTDYPADQLKSFKNEQTDDIFDQDADDVTQILALADQLLYKIMDFNRIDGDGWVNADDTMERTQLKLKEVMRDDQKSNKRS